MKSIRLFLLQSLFAIVMLTSIIACDRECVVGVATLEKKLSPNSLSFFPYDSFDTIQCMIDNQQNLIIQSYEKVDGITKIEEIDNEKCGTDAFYLNHNRSVEYYDSNNKLILKAVMQLEIEDVITVKFSFSNTLLLSSYEIGLDIYEKPDTMTINGIYYKDIFVSKNVELNEEIFYSKSNGLVKVVEDGTVVFQLQH